MQKKVFCLFNISKVFHSYNKTKKYFFPKI